MKYLKPLLLILNFGLILTFCFGIYLSKWILKEELEYGIIGIGIVIILAFLNYIYQRKFEKVNSKRNIINLTLINLTLLIVTLILTYYDTYNGLAIEIGYRFE